uniref:transposase n=1 Tax=Aureibaculum luteum TaxID=1548456 RepID=UPI000E4AC6DA|nr:transposase [Aureibaculum luteum]
MVKGDVQKRCRSLIIQICDAEDIHILKGVVLHDHIHDHLEYRPSQDISTIIKKLKGKNSPYLIRVFCSKLYSFYSICRAETWQHEHQNLSFLHQHNRSQFFSIHLK